MSESAHVAINPASTATPRLLRSLNSTPNANIKAPFCTFRAAIAVTRAFFVRCSESVGGSRWFVDVDVDVALSLGDCSDESGRPKPSANASGFRKPRMPNGSSSSVAITRARHSAGGGRWRRMLRVSVVILRVDIWIINFFVETRGSDGLAGGYCDYEGSWGMQVRTVGEPTLRAPEGLDSLFLSGIRKAGRSAAALLHEVVIDPSLEYPSQSLLLSVKLTRGEPNPQALEDSSYHEVVITS
jgi:hypothetical protein